MSDEDTYSRRCEVITIQRIAAEIGEETAVLERNAARERLRPSFIWRPTLTLDGDQWCALYGANIQEGVAGFGVSPELAMRAFDLAWVSARRAQPEAGR